MAKVSIKQKTIVEQLMSEIRIMIANGAYKHNDKIPTEYELAEHFGVSRTSVREALKALSYLGILESHTSRGTHISEKNRIAEETTAWSVLLSFEKVKEVFVLGTALDTQVVLLLLKKRNQQQENKKTYVKEANAIVKQLRQSAKTNNLDEFRSAFSQYFRVLYKATGNTVFISLNECIDNLIVRKVCESYYQTGKLVNAAEYLSSIWETIREGLLPEAIKLVQGYGEFAFETFSEYELSLGQKDVE